MLVYLFFYLVSAVLVFQGSQALGEQKEPLGAVPEEVAQDATRGSLWGGFLITVGLLSILLGLLSHVVVSLQLMLGKFLAFEFFVMGAYGFYIIFLSRKVTYLGKATADHGHH